MPVLIEYLPYAFKMLESNGGVVHMHSIAAKEQLSKILNEIERKCNDSKLMPKTIVRKVKKYAPNMDHFVFDIQLTRA
jgi:tRNA G37 N-methylase Trm5